jgi:hypothetical protein
MPTLLLSVLTIWGWPYFANASYSASTSCDVSIVIATR